MIELMIAGIVLVVGCLAIVALITTAIATNNRNKLDTTSTMLAQTVIERISGQVATQAAGTLTDCGTHDATNPWTIAVVGGTLGTGNGAKLSSTGTAIDFSEDQSAITANYFMNFVVCSGTQQTTYDVRWNVQKLSTNTMLVTVGARMQGASNNLRYFALPVQLRAIVGP